MFCTKRYFSPFFFLLCTLFFVSMLPKESQAFSLQGFFSDVRLFANSKRVHHDACYERPILQLSIAKKNPVFTDIIPDRNATRHPLGTVQGLTHMTYGFNLVIDTEVLRTPDMYCVRLSRVEVLAGQRPPEIWIAPNIKVGSCEYNVTVDHEREHVAIYHEHLDRFRNAVQNELDPLLIGRSYRIIDDNLDVRVMQESIKNEVFNNISDIHTGIYRTTRLADFAIDSPQEYRRLAGLCR